VIANGQFLPRLFVLVLAIDGQAHAQTTAPKDPGIVTRHGEWTLLCKPPPRGGTRQICAVTQTVVAADHDNARLTAAFEKFSDGRLFLRVVTPWDILLPPGLALAVDNVEIGRAPFVRCAPTGCYAQTIVEGTLAEKLKTGSSAVFTIYQNEQTGLGFPISLKGLDKALAELDALPFEVHQ
jgi:invasion protein IalB